MGKKIGLTCVLLAMRSEEADYVCATLQVWSVQCERNISTILVVQNYSVNTHAVRQGHRPNFCSIADGVIICGGIGSPGSPCLILWFWLIPVNHRVGSHHLAINYVPDNQHVSIQHTLTPSISYSLFSGDPDHWQTPCHMLRKGKCHPQTGFVDNQC